MWVDLTDGRNGLEALVYLETIVKLNFKKQHWKTMIMVYAS